MPHHPSEEMRACIRLCLDCYASCVECTAHCMTMGGVHAEAAHLTALADCATLCEASANFMLRSSELHASVCGVCADACERCAASCERIGGKDDMMRRCAETCRRCAASCRAMAGMAA